MSAIAKETPAVTRDWETWCYQQVAGLVRLSLLPWFIIAFVGLMAFDAPGSEHNLAIWAMVVPVWIYPITAGIGGIIAYFYKRHGNIRNATIALGAPAILTMGIVGLVIGYQSLAATGNAANHRFQDVAESLQ